MLNTIKEMIKIDENLMAVMCIAPLNVLTNPMVIPAVSGQNR